MSAPALGPNTTMLVTGFPSLTARLLLEQILVADRKALLVVHPTEVDRARGLLTEFPQRVELFSGDITRLDLGLSGPEVRLLLEQTEVIFHLAECRDRTMSASHMWRHHVDATQGLLELALAMERLQLLAAFSTVLVSGDRTGIILESELEAGQTFRDHYEKSRYEAELRLRMAQAQLPVAVFRTGIPSGDALTGEQEETDLMHVLIRTMLDLPRDTQFPFPGTGRAPLNISSTSYVTQAAVAIVEAHHPAGETFHLTDPRPASAWSVLESIAEAAGRPKPRSVAIPKRLMRRVLDVKPLRHNHTAHREFLDHLSQRAHYDCTNTTRALADSSLECPAFDSYVHKLVNFVARN